MSDQVQMPVRQAGAIYLKNMVNQFWMERSVDKPNELMPYSLQESDRATIRDNLIEAVIHSPDPIRAQLIVCVRTISQQDFPEKWPTIIDKVHQFIQTNDMNSWYGVLQAYYQLCKIYEYESLFIFYQFKNCDKDNKTNKKQKGTSLQKIERLITRPCRCCCRCFWSVCVSLWRTSPT